MNWSVQYQGLRIQKQHTQALSNPTCAALAEWLIAFSLLHTAQVAKRITLTMKFLQQIA